MTTPLDTAPIAARLAASTPGPWYAVKASERHIQWGAPYRIETPDTTVLAIECNYVDDPPVLDCSKEDLDLVINAPTDIAALLGEIERLRAGGDALAAATRAWLYHPEFGNVDHLFNACADALEAYERNE